MRREKRSVVVGAGVSGMTMALLLARAGRPVTVVEAGPRIGGAMQRFRRGGVPFGTGFHFTGGFDLTLRQMLEVLKLSDFVREEPFRIHLYLAETKRRFSLPGGGLDAVESYLCAEFPKSADQIRRYFVTQRDIVKRTPMFDLYRDEPMEGLALHEAESFTLQEFFDREGISGELAAVLGAAALCHGTPPDEAAMAHHCRVGYGIGNHIARAARGGDGFIDGFLTEAERLGIELRTGCRVIACAKPDSRKESHRLTLSNGGELEAGEVFWAIHPRSILEVLPPEGYRPAFCARVERLEDTCGFFSIYGTLDLMQGAEMTACLSCCDLNHILKPGGARAQGIVTARELDHQGNPVQTFTAFENEFADELKQWSQIEKRRRDAAYPAYKVRKTGELLEKVYEAYPQWRGKVKLYAAGSMLTFRDYIPPTGCAYGVRQKLGEQRLFGRLPVRNFYAIGQSALLPGVMGSMMTSFLLFRQLCGREVYIRLLREAATPGGMLDLLKAVSQ